jgi:membrane fusion protein (multidrug efflux system)
MPTPERIKTQRRSWAIAAWCVAGAAVIGVSSVFLYSAYTHETTDNAFVDGHIIPISPQIDGRVIHVLVTDNQPVQKGDRLVEIDPSDYLIRRDQARADLLSAQAQLRRVTEDLARYEELARTDDVTRQQLDNTRAERNALAAQEQKAKAALDKAELDLSRTVINAPEDGQVTKKSVEEGACVRPPFPLLAIVPSNVWVTANFKETQLKHMVPGQRVTFKADAIGGRDYTGHVESLQSGTGAAFSLLPPENATGNYVKVVQRIPVKIVIDSGNDDHRLVPGMSVMPTVRVR